MRVLFRHVDKEGRGGGGGREFVVNHSRFNQVMSSWSIIVPS